MVSLPNPVFADFTIVAMVFSSRNFDPTAFAFGLLGFLFHDKQRVNSPNQNIQEEQSKERVHGVKYQVGVCSFTQPFPKGYERHLPGLPPAWIHSSDKRNIQFPVQFIGF